MINKQQSLFEDFRLTLANAIELSLASLHEYGQRYEHWALAYSGGKDSSAAVTFTWEQSIEEQGIVDISQLTRIDVTKMMRGELDELDSVGEKLHILNGNERGELTWTQKS